MPPPPFPASPADTSIIFFPRLQRGFPIPAGAADDDADSIASFESFNALSDGGGGGGASAGGDPYGDGDDDFGDLALAEDDDLLPSALLFGPSADASVSVTGLTLHEHPGEGGGGGESRSGDDDGGDGNDGGGDSAQASPVPGGGAGTTPEGSPSPGGALSPSGEGEGDRERRRGRESQREKERELKQQRMEQFVCPPLALGSGSGSGRGRGNGGKGRAECPGAQRPWKEAVRAAQEEAEKQARSLPLFVVSLLCLRRSRVAVSIAPLGAVGGRWEADLYRAALLPPPRANANAAKEGSACVSLWPSR